MIRNICEAKHIDAQITADETFSSLIDTKLKVKTIDNFAQLDITLSIHQKRMWRSNNSSSTIFFPSVHISSQNSLIHSLRSAQYKFNARQNSSTFT